MNEKAVKDIYNKLYSLESNVRKGDVYPIHKKLVFDDHKEIKDIYGWLSNHIPFHDGDNVLDAGCGVGFGSCLLASQNNIQITGISLSDKEIAQASNFAQSAGLQDQVSFRQQSFDDLEKNTYHKIIAVESVKHSFDLDHTLKGMKEALVQGGRLYIVEDYYQTQQLTSDALKYQNDWSLVDVFRLSDYYKILEESDTEYHDLTSYMPTKSKLMTELKLAFNNGASLLQNDKKMNVNKIFRGGYYLDRLYGKGMMKYGVLEYQKQ